MVEVIPGILEKDWSEIERKIEIVRPFAKSLHIDLIDGKFSPFTTFLDPAPFAKYSSDFLLEAHLMVDNPIQYLDSLAKAGFKRFIGHIEMMPDQAEFVAKAQELGEAGLAIDGPTALSAVQVPYSDLDCLLVMMIKAGQSGQAFSREYLKKIDAIRNLQSEISIEVDGGINDQTILLAKAVGVNRAVSTSYIFNNEDPQSQFNLLKNGGE